MVGVLGNAPSGPEGKRFTVSPVSLADYTPKLNEGISTLTQRKEMFMKKRYNHKLQSILVSFSNQGQEVRPNLNYLSLKPRKGIDILRVIIFTMFNNKLLSSDKR